MHDQKPEAPAVLTPPDTSKPAAPAPATPRSSATTVAPNNPKPAGEKTADKPHPITIRLGLLGLLSPLVAVLALYISVQALRTNERSLAIGQRAYVSMQDGKMTFSHIILGPPPSPGNPVLPFGAVRSQPGQEQLATLLLTANLVNSGNTPAEFARFTPTFKPLPEGWTLKPHEWQPLQKAPPYLGAKSQEPWEYRASFQLTPEAWSRYLQHGPLPAMYFSGELLYLDVFKAEHSVDWCWMTLADERNGGRVSDCDKNVFERTR